MKQQELDAIRERLQEDMLPEDYDAMKISDIARLRMDAKRLLKYAGQLQAERDAAIKDLQAIGQRECLCACIACSYQYDADYYPCNECREHSNKWQWRGAERSEG